MSGFAADGPPAAAGFGQQGGGAEPGARAEHDLGSERIGCKGVANGREVAFREKWQGERLGFEVVQQADPFDPQGFGDGGRVYGPVAVGHHGASVRHRPGHRDHSKIDRGFAEIAPRGVLERRMVVCRKRVRSFRRSAVPAQGETDIRAA